VVLFSLGVVAYVWIICCFCTCRNMYNSNEMFYRKNSSPFYPQQTFCTGEGWFQNSMKMTMHCFLYRIGILKDFSLTLRSFFWKRKSHLGLSWKYVIKNIYKVQLTFYFNNVCTFQCWTYIRFINFTKFISKSKSSILKSGIIGTIFKYS